jgi:hypothetical protein
LACHYSRPADAVIRERPALLFDHTLFGRTHGRIPAGTIKRSETAEKIFMRNRLRVQIAFKSSSTFHPAGPR